MMNKVMKNIFCSTFLASIPFLTIAAPIIEENRATIELPNGSELVLRKIESGSFQMGAPDDDSNAKPVEKPRHQVSISSDFWIGESEVTVGQFQAFVNATGYETDAELSGDAYGIAENGQIMPVAGNDWKNPGFDQAENHPVVNISWFDAVAFSDWLGEYSGFNVSLPTEAQWEYAARGGVDSIYLFGDEQTDAKGWMNIREELAPDFMNWDDGFEFTAPVKSFNANDFGLFDVHGNVWEWTLDRTRTYSHESQTDPTGDPNSLVHSIRGGSWFNNFEDQRLSSRGTNPPDFRMFLIGFRVASDGTPWEPKAIEYPDSISVTKSGEKFEVTFSYTPEIKPEKSVSLAGSLNDWDGESLPMTDNNGDGTYQVTATLPEGRHDYKFVIDGEEWIRDPLNPDISGQYGNSLLVLGIVTESVDPGGSDVYENYNYQIDESHSVVEWELDYQELGPFTGSFREIKGGINIDFENPEETIIHIAVPVASIDSRSDSRDQYVRGNEFLSVDEHPYATFISSKVEQVADNIWRAEGDLSIRGQKLPLEFQFEITGISEDQSHIAARAKTSFDRTDYGMKSAIPSVGSKITMDIIIHAMK